MKYEYLNTDPETGRPLDPISGEAISDEQADSIEKWHRDRHERVVEWLETRKAAPASNPRSQASTQREFEWRWWYMFKQPLFWWLLAFLVLYFVVGYIVGGTPPWPIGGTGS